MNTAKKIHDRLLGLCTHVLFNYNGQMCGIDPLSASEFDMWYGKKEYTASSIDEVMNHPLFDGKSISEIAGDITELEL